MGMVFDEWTTARFTFATRASTMGQTPEATGAAISPLMRRETMRRRSFVPNLASRARFRKTGRCTTKTNLPACERATLS